MEVNCTSPHEHNINGYSTHVTALFPEHVRAMYMLECTSPKEELNEYFGKFTGYDGIYVNDYKRMLVAFVTEIFHANFMNETTTKKKLYIVWYINEGRHTAEGYCGYGAYMFLEVRAGRMCWCCVRRTDGLSLISVSRNTDE